jgi:acyl-coenzyme A thioesterase PaaI-like protein
MQRSTHSFQVHPDNCFACGKANQHGLQLDFRFNPETEKIQTPITFSEKHSNTPTTVHGGILSTILDEAMGSLCSHLGSIVVTAEITIHYHKMVNLNEAYFLEAWKENEDNRFFYIRGELRNVHNDFIHTEAHGRFRKIPLRFFKKFFPKHLDKIKKISRQIELNRELLKNKS